MVEPDGIHEAFDGGVNVGIVEYDVGRFAAQFEGERFAGACRGFADAAAYGGGACEGDLVDVCVDEGLACFSISSDNVDDALGHACLLAKLGKNHR